MEPSKPVISLHEQSSECVCGNVVDWSWVVTHASGSACDVQTCTSCWQRWTLVNVDKNRESDSVSCICNKEMVSLTTLGSILPAEDFSRFSGRRSINTARGMPDFIECPSADCTYGHFHKVEEDGREWTCKKCGKLACASCRAPWHQDETCEQYSTRTSDHLENVRIIENDNSERSVIECPSCKIKIQKADGCDHMTCNCGAQFCYDCRALFLPGKTEGWENTLAVLHESECRHYKKDGRGYEILGLTWQEFRDIKAEVFFGLVHGEIMIRCSSDGKKVFAEVLTNRVTIWWE